MRTLIVILIICLCFIPLVSAINETGENFTITTTESNVIKPLPEEFYGNAIYSDNSPILTGSIITVINQDGKLIGNFTIIDNGSYGDMHASAIRLMVYGESTNDKMTFYIDGIKTSTTSREFDSAAIKRADLVIPTSSKPAPTPTPEPTTPEVTPTPEPTTPEVTPTPEPTTIVPTIVTTIPTLAPTPAPIINNTTIKFLGVLLISIAICVSGAIITYFILTKKMKRDDEEDIIL